MDIKRLITEFVELIENDKVEIYNEASLQYELAIFLRNKYPDYKIQLERNISYFGLDKLEFEKKEMDIIIFKDKNNLKEAIIIELKAIIGQNKDRPVTVFQWIKDLRFLEELKSEGAKCYSIFFTDEDKFLSGTNNVGDLLKNFRNRKVEGTYYKHQNSKKNNKITLDKYYSFDWKEIKNDQELKYFMIEI
jgi:hypothetical protein